MINTDDEDTDSDGETALHKVQESQTDLRGGSRRGPSSDTLQYFTKPKRDNGHWAFRCTISGCKAVRSVPATPGCPSFYDEKPRPGISNFTLHVRKHKQNSEIKTTGNDTPPDLKDTDAASCKLMDCFIKAGLRNPAYEPTYKGFLQVIAAWILKDDLPFTTGENQITLPSHTTVRNTLDAIMKELHCNLVNEISCVQSRISYSTDVWTNRQMVFSFSGVIAHWIDDDWNLVERLIDFKHLDDHKHAGEYPAKAFIQSASSRGGLNKITIVMDNASSCDKMANFLALFLGKRYSDLHVLEEAESPDDVDYYFLHKDQPIHYDEAEDEELKAMEEEGCEEEDDSNDADDADKDESEDDGLETSDIREARFASALKQLRIITTKIVSSPQRRAKFRNLSKEDWKSLEEIECILEKKVNALKKHDKFSKYSDALDAGLKKLSKYHELAKKNQFYVVATTCHPSFRLNWFGKWQSEDHLHAHAIFKHVYESYALSTPSSSNGTSPVKPKKASVHVELVQELLDDIPSDDEVLPDSSAGLSSELERYLAGEGGAGETMKPLEWWKNHCKTTKNT
ncbi:hypothetical protein D9758_014433 [Tetrapyrgos nigripes]|uniref:Uncharacterized protein n=1 Tax=Tetrapyrgos nigripes TaxID=182062 RepID=A0A8H5CPT6_9AGAR|nr:hypothetical protein D9758_014433 [Tetrapyrgos nigripes]